MNDSVCEQGQLYRFHLYPRIAKHNIGRINCNTYHRQFLNCTYSISHNCTYIPQKPSQMFLRIKWQQHIFDSNIVPALKHSKLDKNAPTCFGLHRNHLQGAKVSACLKITRLVNSICVKDVQGFVSAMAAYCDCNKGYVCNMWIKINIKENWIKRDKIGLTL